MRTVPGSAAAGARLARRLALRSMAVGASERSARDRTPREGGCLTVLPSRCPPGQQNPMKPPVLLLCPPRSFSSVVGAMLGQHPELYGFPELSLFAADTLADLVELLRR